VALARRARALDRATLGRAGVGGRPASAGCSAFSALPGASATIALAVYGVLHAIEVALPSSA
jgi:hypothetical protein